jgi:NADP-dependent 3-hydroxy acid dehydrogenase YdfG
MAFPEHMGPNWTSTIHSKAEGPTLPENNKVSGPFVVVMTGAGKGLGYHVSLAYARAGASGICISSRTKANPSIDVLSVICDTSKQEDVKTLAAKTEEHFGGRVDVVVANAGVISNVSNRCSAPLKACACSPRCDPPPSVT